MGSEDAESAIVILRTFAYFHHENITEDIIKRAAEALKAPNGEVCGNVCFPPRLLQLDQAGTWDPHLFCKGIGILLSFSLLRKASGIYSLHPLVHCWSRDSMSDEERQTSFSAASTLLSSSITYRFTSKDLAYRRTIIPHIKALWDSTSYDEERYEKFALAFHEAGHWKEAEELKVQVMQTRKRVLGGDHPHTLRSIANLALTYLQQGRWKEAEELSVQVMQTSKRVLGEEHRDTLIRIGSLAAT